MANLGFNPQVPNAGFQAGQALHVQGAGTGMLQDLVKMWQEDRAKKQDVAQKKELIDYETEAGIKKLGFGEMFKQYYETPPEYTTDLQKAINESLSVKNEDASLEIFQRIAGKYPKKSAELKRILLPKASSNEIDWESLLL